MSAFGMNGPHALTALHSATEERADQLARRQVKVTKQHNEEVRELLGLMGIPWVTVSRKMVQ